MGLRLAQGMGPSFAAAKQTTPPPLTPSWYFGENGSRVGPFTAAHLTQAIQAKRVRAATLVWCTGMPDWKPASEVPSLAPLFQTGPPPLPPREETH